MTAPSRTGWRDPREHDPAHNDSPVPPRLTLIRELGHPIEPLADLAAAAARICELRPRGAGLRLVRSAACFSGSPGFEATAIYVTPAGASMEDWLGCLALPHAEHQALRDAVKAHAAQLRTGGRKAA